MTSPIPAEPGVPMPCGRYPECAQDEPDPCNWPDCAQSDDDPPAAQRCPEGHSRPVRNRRERRNARFRPRRKVAPPWAAVPNREIFDEPPPVLYREGMV